MNGYHTEPKSCSTVSEHANNIFRTPILMFKLVGVTVWQYLQFANTVTCRNITFLTVVRLGDKNLGNTLLTHTGQRTLAVLVLTVVISLQCGFLERYRL